MNPQPDERAGLDSASSAERTHFCPGWQNLRNSIPPEQLPKSSGKAAADGTLIHDALETGDISDLDMTQAEIAEACNRLEMEVLQKWWSTVPMPTGVTTMELKRPECVREKRFWIHDEALAPVTSARLDVGYVFRTHGAVVDFKTGFCPTTPAQRNFQMKVQAVAFAHAYNLTNVRVAIAQHRFKSILSQADYDEAALDRAYQEILFDQWKAKQPDAQRVPGKHCDYCPCKAWCRPFTVYSSMPLIVATGAMTASLPKEDLIARINNLAPSDLAFIWRRLGLMDKMADAVKARLKSMPADELSAIGLQLKDGRRKSDITNAAAIIEHLEKNSLIKEEEIMPLFDLVLGRLEEIVYPRMASAAKAAGEKLTQKDAKEKFRALLQSSGWADFEQRNSPTIEEIA
jgi:hypothetical protein